MKINAINTQNFKALYRNPKLEYTDEQEKIIDNIYKTSGKTEPKYGRTSLLGYLKMEYDMDLFADANSDKKSINLYISENLPATARSDFKSDTRLTFIGNYGLEDSFETRHVDLEIDRMTGKKGTTFVNSIATILAVIGMILTPCLGVVALLKDKSAPKAEQVIKHAADSLNTLPKDTLNLAKKFIK